MAYARGKDGMVVLSGARWIPGVGGDRGWRGEVKAKVEVEGWRSLPVGANRRSTGSWGRRVAPLRGWVRFGNLLVSDCGHPVGVLEG